MKKRAIIITAVIVALILWSMAFSATVQNRPETNSGILLTGGRLIDGSGRPAVENSLIVIERDKIVYAGRNKAFEKKPGMTAIDCAGKTIFPGLVDGHVHLGGPCAINYVYVEPLKNLAGFLFSGVTSIADMGSMEDWIFQFRDSERKGESISPRIFAAGPMFTAPGGHGTEYGVNTAITPTNEQQAREGVRLLAAKKPDFIKIIDTEGSGKFPTLSLEVMSAVADEAHRNGLKVFIHVGTPQQAEKALRAGADGLAHAMDGVPAGDFFTRMKSKNVFCVPTLTVYDAMLALAENRPAAHGPLMDKGVCADIIENLRTTDPAKLKTYTDQLTRLRERVKTAKANVLAMRASGIKLVLGTDAGNPRVFFGPSVHDELQLLVEAGLSPLEALTAATKNAAEVFGQGGRLGTIEAGKLADLVIVDGNPLADIRDTRKIHRVVKNGRVYDPVELAKLVNPPVLPALPAGQLPAVFDDFEDGDLSTGWGTMWTTATDDVAGGSSTAKTEISSPGAGGSAHALRIFGELTTKFSYPFFTLMAPSAKENGRMVDVSGYRGIRFRAKGDGKTYRVSLGTASVKDHDDFFAFFTTSPDWRDIDVSFDGLKQFGFGKKVDWNGKEAISLMFMNSEFKAGRFELFVDDIRFYK